MLVVTIVLAFLGLGWCLWYIFSQLCLAKKRGDERKPDGGVKYVYVDEYEEGDDLIVNLKKI